MTGAYFSDSNQTSIPPLRPQGVEEMKRSAVAAICNGVPPFRFNSRIGVQRAPLQFLRNFMEMEEE